MSIDVVTIGTIFSFAIWVAVSQESFTNKRYKLAKNDTTAFSRNVIDIIAKGKKSSIVNI